MNRSFVRQIICIGRNQIDITILYFSSLVCLGHRGPLLRWKVWKTGRQSNFKLPWSAPTEAIDREDGMAGGVNSMRLAMAGAALTISVCAASAHADTILFVGNSFTYGALSPVWHYRAGSVTDLNNEGIGGTPALFKLFTQEAGLIYDVSLETSPGKDLQWHIDHKTPVIDRAFDHVVLQSFSTLDAAHPGDPTSLIKSTGVMAAMFQAKNPKVDIWLDSTWSRADLTYQPAGHWYGKPITAMALDMRAGYDKAWMANPGVHGVLPVGQAFSRAIATGFATPNPYKGEGPGQIDLWAFDNYHASAFGYYLEALIEFGAITGKDPLSLGPKETAAQELGISPAQATTLQQIAHDQLAAEKR